MVILVDFPKSFQKGRSMVIGHECRVAIIDSPGISHTFFHQPPCVVDKEDQCTHTHSWRIGRCISLIRKSSVFTVSTCKKKYRARVPTILMPPTFPIASLNRYTPNFSGVPQKLTWCQQFGLQIFPKWGDADICPLEMAVFRCFFGRNKFSRPNGRLSPIACLTYLESYGT